MPEEIPERLKLEIHSIDKALASDGLFFVSDFQMDKNLINKLWQIPLISLLYLFFNLTTGMTNSKLEDIFNKIGQNSFREIYSHSYFSNLIVSKVFTRYHQKQGF